MKKHELLEQLKDVPYYADIYLWVDGNRYAITDVDDSMAAESNFVDLNANVDTKGE
jgi:hypothetical protein